VRVTITGPVAADGMIANYAVFKERVRVLCDAWDEMYLIPSLSPYVTVRQEDDR
jgi:6-pyruvoyl-tetrahydropterin synthase